MKPVTSGEDGCNTHSLAKTQWRDLVSYFREIQVMIQP
jgi:hypothetical protein